MSKEPNGSATTANGKRDPVPEFKVVDFEVDLPGSRAASASVCTTPAFP